MPKKTGCHWLQRDSLSRWVSTADRWEWGCGNWSCCCAAPMSDGGRLLLGRGHGPSVTGPCHLIVGARRPQGGTGRHRALLNSRLFSHLWAPGPQTLLHWDSPHSHPERGLPLPTSLKSCRRREGGTRPREAWVRDFIHPLGWAVLISASRPGCPEALWSGAHPGLGDSSVQTFGSHPGLFLQCSGDGVQGGRKKPVL